MQIEDVVVSVVLVHLVVASARTPRPLALTSSKQRGDLRSMAEAPSNSTDPDCSQLDDCATSPVQWACNQSCCCCDSYSSRQYSPFSSSRRLSSLHQRLLHPPDAPRASTSIWSSAVGRLWLP